jgi:hypothetical protein
VILAPRLMRLAASLRRAELIAALSQTAWMVTSINQSPC